MSVNFDLSLHSEFVGFHGQPFNYYKASLCPCGSGPNSRDANRSLINCATCNGIGLIYSQPTTLVGLITAMRNLKDLADFGMTEPGDLVLGMSPQSSVFVNDWDLIQPQFSIGFNGQILTRGQGTSDVLDYPPQTVFRCSAINFANNYQLIDFTLGADFVISGRTISWTNSTNVTQFLPPSTNYSISYNAIFDYIALYSPMERWDNGSDIGQRVLLRRRHIVLPLMPAITPTVPSAVTPVTLYKLMLATITGLVNGINAVFNVSPTPPNGILLFRDGLAMQQGTGNDYNLVGSTITFTTPPQIGSILVAYILLQ